MLSEKFKENDKKLKEQKYLFTSQWGNLVESLVEGDIVTLLSQRGINVTDTIERRKGRRDGINYEFDIITINDFEMVIVEVKTTLRSEDIRHFLKKIIERNLCHEHYMNNHLIIIIKCSFYMGGISDQYGI